MDFTGRGFITEQDFLGSIVVTRLQAAKLFNPEDIQEYFKQNNLFPHTLNGMTLDRFKKVFFPHLYQINESEESEDEKKAKQD